MAEVKLEDLASQVLKSVQSNPQLLTKIMGGDTASLSKLLGNVKLDASQLSTLTNLIKKSSAAKQILGDDGKLDASDLTRLAQSASKDPSELMNLASGLLGKKK